MVMNPLCRKVIVARRYIRKDARETSEAFRNFTPFQFLLITELIPLYSPASISVLCLLTYWKLANCFKRTGRNSSKF